MKIIQCLTGFTIISHSNILSSSMDKVTGKSEFFLKELPSSASYKAHSRIRSILTSVVEYQMISIFFWKFNPDHILNIFVAFAHFF